MAEILGAAASVLTLVGVFKVCIEAFELIRASRNHEAEVKKLMLKLKIEKCRLLVWGQSMGLVPGAEGKGPIVLEDCPYADLVRETLESILDLVSNSHGLSGKYGCRSIDVNEDHLEDDNGLAMPSDKLNSAFSRLQLRSSKAKEVTRRARWAICDKKKFEVLIRDTKDFVDGLQDITKELVTQRKQERDFSLRISTINDSETLQMITEVCESDHPAFSDAASFRADAMTLAISDKQDIMQWLDDADTRSDIVGPLENMEDWDLEEWRRRYLVLSGTNMTLTHKHDQTDRNNLDVAEEQTRDKEELERLRKQEQQIKNMVKDYEEEIEEDDYEDGLDTKFVGDETQETKQQPVPQQSEPQPDEEEIQQDEVEDDDDDSEAERYDKIATLQKQVALMAKQMGELIQRKPKKNKSKPYTDEKPKPVYGIILASSNSQGNQTYPAPASKIDMSPEAKKDAMQAVIANMLLRLNASRDVNAEGATNTNVAKPAPSSLLASWVDQAFQLGQGASTPLQQIADLSSAKAVEESLNRSTRQLRYIESSGHPSNPYASRVYRSKTLAEEATENKSGSDTPMISDGDIWAFIKEMDLMCFGPSSIDMALRAARWDTERALTYLLSGIPEGVEIQGKRPYLPPSLKALAASQWPASFTPLALSTHSSALEQPPNDSTKGDLTALEQRLISPNGYNNPDSRGPY